MPDISRKKKDYKEYERKEKLKRDMELRQAQQQAQKKAYPSLKAKLVAEKLSSGAKTTDKDKNATSKKTLPTKYDNPNKGRAINNAEKKKIANNPTFKKVAEDIKNAVVVKDSGKQPKRTAQEQAKIDKVRQQKWSERNANNKRRLDEGSKDIQNRAISGMNGTGVLYGQQESKLDKAFNPMGKFISNAMDSTINNSVPGALYTFATGNHITDNAYNNPYEEQRKQGISAMAGNMAGMALNYGITRSAFNPMLDKATNAVMNGTRLGNAIKSSAIVGKIGQQVGRGTAQDIASGLVKETLSDATIGFGQNAVINYGEGLRGSDFWKQQAQDTALDFLVGGAMEGVGIGNQIRGANRLAKSIAGENVTGFLANAKNKDEYLDFLRTRAKELKGNTLDIDNGRALRNNSLAKQGEYTDEFKKVTAMTDAQFKKYQQGLDPFDEVNRINKAYKKPDDINNLRQTKEPAPEASPDTASARRTQRSKYTPNTTAQETVQGKALRTASNKDDYLDKLAEEIKRIDPRLNTSGKQRLRTGANINADRQRTQDELIDEMARVVNMTDDQFRAYQNGTYMPENIPEPQNVVTDSTSYTVKSSEPEETINTAPEPKVEQPVQKEPAKETTAKEEPDEDWLEDEPINEGGKTGSNNAPDVTKQTNSTTAGGYSVGDRVEHNGYGKGVITAFEGEDDARAVVKFDNGKSVAIPHENATKNGIFKKGSTETAQPKPAEAKAQKETKGKSKSNKTKSKPAKEVKTESVAEPRATALSPEGKDRAILEDYQKVLFDSDYKHIPTPKELAENSNGRYTVEEARDSLRRQLGDGEDEVVEATAKAEEKPAKSKNKSKKTKEDLPNAKEQAETKAEKSKTKETKPKTEEKPAKTENKSKGKTKKTKEELTTAKEQAEVKAETKAPEETKPIEAEKKLTKNENKASKENKTKGKGLATKAEEKSAKTLEDLRSFTNKQKEAFCKEYGIKVEGTGKNGNPLKKDYDEAIEKYFNEVSKSDQTSTFSEDIANINIKRNGNRQYYQDIADKYGIEVEGDVTTKELKERVLNYQKFAQEKIRQKNIPQTEVKAETPAPETKTEVKEEPKAETQEVKAKPTEEPKGNIRTALVTNPDGAREVVRKEGYKSDKEFKTDLRGNGYKVAKTWKGDVSNEAVDEWELLNRKGGMSKAQKDMLPTAKEQAEAKVKKTPAERALEQKEGRKRMQAEAEAEKLKNADAFKKRQEEQQARTAKIAEEIRERRAKAQEAEKSLGSADLTPTEKFDQKLDKFVDGLPNFRKLAYEKDGISEDFGELADKLGIDGKDRPDFLDYLRKKGFDVQDTSFKSGNQKVESYEITLKKNVEPKADVDSTTTTATDVNTTKTSTLDSDYTLSAGDTYTAKASNTYTSKASDKELPKKRKVVRNPLPRKKGDVGAFEVVGGGNTKEFKTSVYTPHDEGIKGAWHRFYNAVFDNASTIDRLDKATGSEGNLSARVTMLRDARGQVGHMIRKAMIDINGKKVGKSLAEIFDPIIKDKNKMNAFEEYAYHLHNIDRAKNGKGIWGKNGYTSAESQAIVNRLKSEHPEFDNIQGELNTFMGQLRQFMVDGGVIDKETADAWAKNYPNYIPTFRNMGAKGGVGNNPRGAGALLHKAKGSGELDLLPIEDQLAGQVERVVTAVRMNELKADMINLFANNKNAKAYGAVISDKSAKEVFGDISKLETANGEVDFDALLDAISKNASEQIEGGKNTISAYINGRKITAHVSNELFQTMQAIENAGNSDLITRAGKWITSPMKFTITGGNPVFTVANMLRDLPTLYIQSKHNMLRTTISLGKAFKEVVKGGEMYDLYKALGGGEAGYYVRGKGFDTSLSIANKNMWDKTKELLTAIGEKGETIPRLAEFISTYEKTGNAKVALRDAAESTVDFSRHGSSDVVRALDAWTLYLNAGMQGIDKFARTVKEHPVRTAYRSAFLISTPFAVLTAINWNNPHYQDLTERVKQNNFCVPNYAGEKDEQGRPMTFFKIPLNREYGTVMGATLDCAFRAFRGEDDAWKGYGETVKTNFLPSNPITDNVLAPLYFNIPENKDFAGRAIISNALKDAPAKDQYDYSTSGFAKGVSKVANTVMGDNDFGILGYLKSPMLVDYLMDSYSGYYGDVLQTSTSSTAGTVGERIQGVGLDPFTQKFNGDARYSSKPVADAYDLLDKYTSEKKHEELNGRANSEAHAAYKAISNIITEISESSKAEKELMADPTLSKKERTEMIKDLREGRNALAKDAKKAIEQAKAEYREAPTFASLQKDTKAKWSEDIGMDKETWAKQYTDLQAKSKKDEDGNGGMTADEKRFYLLEQGVKTYKQAQSLLGENTSKDKWKDAKKEFKSGKTFKDAQADAKAEKEKEERQKNMTKEEKSFENYFKSRVTDRYDGKTVKQSVINEYISRAKYADSQNGGNGSITQAEAKSALDSMNLTRAQKAYIWSISNDWKRNPYA